MLDLGLDALNDSITVIVGSLHVESSDRAVALGARGRHLNIGAAVGVDNTEGMAARQEEGRVAGRRWLHVASDASVGQGIAMRRARYVLPVGVAVDAHEDVGLRAMVRTETTAGNGEGSHT